MTITTAYYEDENGNQVPISESEIKTHLHDIRSGKLGTLTDKDGFDRYYVQKRKGRYIFCHMPGTHQRKILTRAKSNEHKDRIKYLIDCLDTRATQLVDQKAVKGTDLERKVHLARGIDRDPTTGSFVIKFSSDRILIVQLTTDDPNDEPITVLKTREERYRWRTEALRFISDGPAVQHDLYGHAIDPGMSVHKPSIAIEVVHSHAPSLWSFEEMLKMSEANNVLILFDFLSQNHRDFDLVELINEKIIRIRASTYIAGGKLFLRGVEHSVTLDVERAQALEQLDSWTV